MRIWITAPSQGYYRHQGPLALLIFCNGNLCEICSFPSVQEESMQKLLGIKFYSLSEEWEKNASKSFRQNYELLSLQELQYLDHVHQDLIELLSFYRDLHFLASWCTPRGHAGKDMFPHSLLKTESRESWKCTICGSAVSWIISYPRCGWSTLTGKEMKISFW